MSNLSRQKFDKERWEEIQQRRFGRRRESGYSGGGYWYWNYPNMVGTLGSGQLIQSQSESVEGVGSGEGVSDTSLGGGMA
jgi:hypothetical protein